MKPCAHCGDSHPAGTVACPRTGDRMDAPGPCGTRIDRYDVVRWLGGGGFGSVYLATHTMLGQPVALKLLKAHLATSHEATERFVREARAAAAVQHPNIVRVTDFGSVQGAPFLVMEKLDGTDVDALLTNGRTVPVQRAVQIVLDVLAGLEAAHAHGVVHRDMKPGNVFLAREGSREVVKILDFGISKLLSAGPGATLTRTGVVMGTPAYMAPEQLGGAHEVDARADLYAVAVMLYQMISGRLPYEAETYERLIVKVCTEAPRPLHSVVPGLPSLLLEAVARGLARDPDARFASAAQMADALRRAQTTLPASTDAFAATAAIPSVSPEAIAAASGAQPWGALPLSTPPPPSGHVPAPATGPSSGSHWGPTGPVTPAPSASSAAYPRGGLTAPATPIGGQPIASAPAPAALPSFPQTAGSGAPPSSAPPFGAAPGPYGVAPGQTPMGYATPAPAFGAMSPTPMSVAVQPRGGSRTTSILLVALGATIATCVVGIGTVVVLDRFDGAPPEAAAATLAPTPAAPVAPAPAAGSGKFDPPPQTPPAAPDPFAGLDRLGLDLSELPGIAPPREQTSIAITDHVVVDWEMLGTIDAAAVAAVLEQAQRSFETCRQPGRVERVKAQIFVNSDGSIPIAQASFDNAGDPAVARCIASRFREAASGWHPGRDADGILKLTATVPPR